MLALALISSWLNAMSSDEFASPKSLLGHARDLIKSANQIVDEFVAAQSTTRIVRTDPVTMAQVHSAKLSGPELPAKLANIVKDASGNLRDALDHSVYSAAVALGGGVPVKTGFPFAKDAAGVKGELGSKRLADNPPEIRPFLAALDPHEGENQILWGLNQMRNPGTHRFIVPVATVASFNQIVVNNALLQGGTKLGYNEWNPRTNEVEYLTLGPGSHIEYNVSIGAYVAFKGIAAIESKPVVPTLNEMANEVEKIVGAIEAECNRIIKSRP